MSFHVQCPKCQTPITLDAKRPGEKARCPSCGARIRPDAESAGSSAGDEKDRSSPKKRKKKKPKQAGINRGILFGVIGGGVLLVLVSAGVIFLFAFGRGKGHGLLGGLTGENDFTVVVDSVPPAPALALPAGQKPSAVALPPEPPASGRLEPPKSNRPWQVAPDPSSEPEWDVPDKWGLPAYGVPIAASHGGPFAYVIPHMVYNGSPTLSAIDLRTGKPAPGGFAQKAGVGIGGLLSPDGRFFVTDDSLRDPAITPKEGPPLLVWQNDGKDPAVRLAMRGVLLWHDFIAADKLAVALYDWENPEGAPKAPPAKIIYQVWDVATGKSIVKTTLGPEDVAVVPVPLANEADQDKEMQRGYAAPFFFTRLFNDSRPVMGAVSPGGKYVVLGGRNHVTILEAATGKIAGELPLAIPLGRRCYQGFGFSPDGGSLYGLIDFLPAPAPGTTAYRHNVRLVTWSMKDAAVTADVIMGDRGLCGQILSGPDPSMLIVPIRVADALGLARRFAVNSVEIVGPAQVVMTETGIPFLPLKEMRPLRWLKSGRLLAAGPMNLAPDVPPDKNFPNGMFVLPFGKEEVRAKAKDDYDAVAARPPVAAPNRAGISAAAPTPPPQWAVPKVQAMPAVGTELPAWPAAFSDTQAAVIRFTSESKPIYRMPVSWERVDLASGKSLGTVKLWPWSASYQDEKAITYWTLNSETGICAALTADGKRLALRDPADPSRVDIWEETGQRLVGVRPYDGKAIEWLSLAANGNLLTLGAGKLTAWKVPEAKAVYEVDGGYVGTPQFALGRGWLAATVGGKVDFLDSANGKCLGRIEDQPYAEGPGHTMSISPDGRYLVRVGIGQAKTHGGNDISVFTVARVWDTTTGKPLTSIRIAGSSLRGVFWLGPHQFIANDQLVDVNAAAAICGYRFPRNFPWPSEHESVQVRGGLKDADLTRATPQGRLFLQTKTGWKANAVPTAGADSALSGDPEYAYHPGVPLRIEVKSKVKEAGQKLADNMAEIMRDRGATIGPGGWVLKLTYAVTDSKDTSVKFTGALAGMKMPEMNYTWSLMAPDGATAWSKSNTMKWGFMGSKYAGGTKAAGPYMGPMAPSIRETSLDFKGRDPHTAIEEELHEQLAGIATAFPPEVPRAVLKGSTGFVLLPLTAEYAVPGK
jgi:hypothetical protein